MNFPKNTFVVDIEADDLIEKATKIHVLGYHRLGTKEVRTLTDYSEIRRFFNQPDLCVIGHNFYLYDSIVLDKLLGVGFDYKIIDTLAMSWYLYPRELKHGLEAWGDNPKIGIKKVQIDDWVNGDIESYIERVTQDVKINANLFYYLKKDLLDLYSDSAAAENVLDLLNSILDLYREQYYNPFVLDVPLTEKNLAELLSMKEQREESLRKLLPPVPIKTKKEKPKVLYKKDGSLSENGIKWYKLLDEIGASRDVEMVATGTTGLMVERAGVEKVECVNSGPRGGDAEIGAMVSRKEIDAVIFFRDPLDKHPHEVDVSMLMRLCDVHEVPLATNYKSANIFIKYFKNK